MRFLWPSGPFPHLVPLDAKRSGSLIEESALVSQTSSISSSPPRISVPPCLLWKMDSLQDWTPGLDPPIGCLSHMQPVLRCFSGALKLTCHPRTYRTLQFLCQSSWFYLMAKDTREFVAACSVCARGKSCHQFPAGLLHPLAILSRLSSYCSGLYHQFTPIRR